MSLPVDQSGGPRWTSSTSKSSDASDSADLSPRSAGSPVVDDVQMKQNGQHYGGVICETDQATGPSPLDTETDLCQKLATTNLAKKGLEEQIARLEKEIQVCRKREVATRAVFINNYEQGQELAKRQRRLDKQEREQKDEAERVIASQKAEDDKRKVERKYLDEQNALIDQRIIAQEELTGSHGTIALKCTLDHKEDTKTTFLNDKKVKKDATSTLEIGPSAGHFGLKRDSDLDEWNVPTVQTNTFEVNWLRRYDYYRGWLDCAKVSDHEEALQQGMINEEEVAYLKDWYNPKNPWNAGCVVGANFTWTTLCNIHQKPEWLTLDNRQWGFHDLTPTLGTRPGMFWEGVKVGRCRTKEMFLDKLGEGAAKTTG
ncbi:hypothetical protein K505DRAFT_374129 [Melanomma pulvis-pyrius CBS 109.77]|uniref:Uncharacterized protein n=1 Tax=Melanomma pulvis-pyrius CBS 109.77 TaxID=1314802 RepID=A0A6A6XF26_9PLEO|nr:hypothetical protein K505DRAFT_374129 [Melanomma pulvis-pyrius CBS 109.77]